MELATFKATEEGWTVRNYKACQRMIDAIPKAVILKKRHGEEAYVNHVEPFIERDYTSIDSNGMWNADHHNFDLIVSHGGKLLRPWLTAFQDIRSRKIVGWLVYGHDPNSDTIFTAFRSAVLAHGVPAALLIDNGKDFDCAALNGRTKAQRWAKRKIRVELDAAQAQGVFAELKIAQYSGGVSPAAEPSKEAGLFNELSIDVGHAQPYKGQSKPVERWFKDVASKMRLWPTFCGNKPADRPEDLQAKLDRGEAPALADFAAWFDEFVTQYNAGHTHHGDGMSGRTPDQVYAENLHQKRTTTRELLDVLCLRKIGPIRVQQNGVTWKGIRYGQFEPQLQRMFGEQVYLRIDERDIAQVQVHSAADQWLCLAPSNEKLGFNADAQALRTAMREKRKVHEQTKAFHQSRLRMVDDLPDIMNQIAADKARAARRQPTLPSSPTLQPINHPLQDQLPAIRRSAKRGNAAAVASHTAEASEHVSIFRALADKLKREREAREAAESSPSGGEMTFRELMGIRAIGGA